MSLIYKKSVTWAESILRKGAFQTIQNGLCSVRLIIPSYSYELDLTTWQCPYVEDLIGNCLENAMERRIVQIMESIKH